MLFHYQHRTDAGDEDFRKDFIGILKNGTDFDEYNFECPPANRKTSGDNSYPFEFILMKSGGMFLNFQSIHFKKSQMNCHFNTYFRSQK